MFGHVAGSLQAVASSLAARLLEDRVYRRLGRLKKHATYEDLREVPDHFVAEMFDGELCAAPFDAIELEPGALWSQRLERLSSPTSTLSSRRRAT